MLASEQNDEIKHDVYKGHHPRDHLKAVWWPKTSVSFDRKINDLIISSQTFDTNVFKVQAATFF